MTDHFSGAVTAAAERCSQKQPASKFCWRRVDPNLGTETAEAGGVERGRGVWLYAGKQR